MVPEVARPTVDGPHEIVPLSITVKSQTQMTDTSGYLSSDATSGLEALVAIINGCKVTINNHAGRDVIYHTIFALWGL